MAVVTEEVQELVDFEPEDALVTSFYLNVNAGEFTSPDQLRTSLDSALHGAEEKRKAIEPDLSHDAVESLRQDLEKIEQFVDRDFHREDTNGLAIFSCSAQDFWHVFQSPTELSTRVEFDHRPYVAPLAAFLSHTKPTAILVTDRQKARIFTMGEGHVKEWTDIEDWVPHRSEKGGWSQMRYQRRSDHWAKHHIDHMAELVLKLDQHHPFDWLILGVSVEAQHDLEEGLHPYVKDRVIGNISVAINAPEAEVIEKARSLREEVEAGLIKKLMAQIQEYAGAGGRATLGLKDTLDGLNEQRVHILVVQGGYSSPGSVCTNCGLLLASQPETCPACSEPVRHVDNVVESAIQRAFELSSRVEVATEQDVLEPIQCIGAVLYY